MCSLQNNRSVIIKPVDKGSAVVVWDRQDYLKEAERQLSDSSICKEANVTEKDLVDLVDKSRKDNDYSREGEKQGESYQGIIQKKSASSSRTQPFVIFDKKVPFFPKMVLF